MLVIVEGIDGSGKTTLCNALQRSSSDYEVIRKERGDPKLSSSDIEYYTTTDKIIVMDRMVLTPWAYRIFDNGKLDSVDFNFTQSLNILASSLLIYCNNSNAYSWSMQRGETNIKSFDDSEKLRNIYNVIIGTIKLYNLSTVFEYDFEKNSVEDVIKFIQGGSKNAVRQLCYPRYRFLHG